MWYIRESNSDIARLSKIQTAEHLCPKWNFICLAPRLYLFSDRNFSAVTRTIHPKDLFYIPKCPKFCSKTLFIGVQSFTGLIYTSILIFVWSGDPQVTCHYFKKVWTHLWKLGLRYRCFDLPNSFSVIAEFLKWRSTTTCNQNRFVFSARQRRGVHHQSQ